jgi:hypothetical protein
MNTNTINGKNIGSNLIIALTFYSPIIITTSILILSLFSGAIGKGLFFIFWILVITALRIFIMWLIPNNSVTPSYMNPVCNTGNFLPYDNVTYSIFILCFSFFYFATPMFILNNINYLVVLFFIVYIVFDIFVKMSNRCVLSFRTMFGDIIGGGGLGALIATLIYSSPIRSYLFINEISSNKQVCSMSSKQQFKCAVYKNGELIGSSVR